MALVDYARQSVALARGRGYGVRNGHDAVDIAMSAQGELLATNPDATKFQLIDAGYNAIRAEQYAFLKSWGYTTRGTRAAWATAYAVPTAQFDDADDVIRRVDAERLVRSFWGKLHQDHREVFTLLADGHSRREVARILGVHLDTVDRRVWSGRESVRRVLAGEPALKLRRRHG